MTGPAIDVMVDGEPKDDTVGGAAARARAVERVEAVVMGCSGAALVPRRVDLAGAAVATAVGRAVVVGDCDAG